MKKQRIDRFLSGQLNLSRTESRKAIYRKQVTVNDTVCRDIGQLISPDMDVIRYNGETVSFEEHIYLLMHKPKGILSVSNDKTRQTVVDLVPPELYRKGIFPVGRLDKDTTGLLLLTDDGIFAHEVTAPKSHITKSYVAELDGPIPEEAVSLFRKGVTLSDGTVCKPAILEPLDRFRARLILCEGKYHEVKRMFGTIGLGVNALHRESVGDLTLPDDLEVGTCRKLLSEEVEKVKKQSTYTF